MGPYATIKVRVMGPIGPVGKEINLITRTGETDYIDTVFGPIQGKTVP